MFGKSIYIFNPDTDYALASGSPYYTPPKSIVRLIHEMAYFPKRFAGVEDIVVPYHKIDQILTVIGGVDNLQNYAIRPWGWNARIRGQLLDAGVPEHKLPTTEDIDRLRELSHRRTTIRGNEMLNKLLISYNVNPHHLSPLPLEFYSEDELLDYYHNTKDETFIKAPWSSSGRGIMYTGDNRDEQIREWAHGIIRRQGSVMYEPAADKVLDFATEWNIVDGEPAYWGLSLFETSSRGKYHGNIDISQREITDRIRQFAPDFDNRWIESQYDMLGKLIGKQYQGPLGIDMLVDRTGAIRGCIEINLRMTMGHATLLESRHSSDLSDL
ncbi:MAG: hypothetical protein K2H86_00565 [Muribaculaceae bacterium]|nr:hypothetical protein [Muribaculaceae bacterium]